MTRHPWATIGLAAAAALGEAALVALATPDRSQAGANALLLAFLVGPFLFLGVAAWRRRGHPGRSRVLLGAAAAVAAGGLGVLGTDLYRFSTDPAFRRTPNAHGVLVPVVQWVAILVVWAWLVFQETRDKRAARNRSQSA